jgi:hypothetical protein
LDSEKYEKWRVWFGCYEGKIRTPEDEVRDLIGARMLTHSINSQRSSGCAAEIRELMLFPPPITQSEIDEKIQLAKAKMRAYCSVIRGIKGNQ